MLREEYSGVRTSRVLLGVLNNRSRDPPRSGRQRNVRLRDSCTRSTTGGTSGIGSVLNLAWVSDAANPVPNLLFTRHTSKPALDFLRQVLNVYFMVSSKDGATSFLDPRRALRFFASGFCHPPYLGVPNVSASVSATEVCDPSKVEATDHQSYLTGNQSRLPLDRMFQLSGRLNIHQHRISCVGPPAVTRDGFSFFLPRIKPSATVTHASLSSLQSLFQSL